MSSLLTPPANRPGCSFRRKCRRARFSPALILSVDARGKVDHRNFIQHRPSGNRGSQARIPWRGSSQYLQIIHKAWTIPGRYPRMVKRMLIRRSELHPRSRKTPSGGRMTAKMILQISLAVKGMLTVFVGCRYSLFGSAVDSVDKLGGLEVIANWCVKRRKTRGGCW
jgi:hypothetical protein